MAAKESVLEVDFFQEDATEPFFPRPPLLTSYQVGWKSLQLAHYKQNGFDMPELRSNVHIISLANWQQGNEVTMNTEGQRNRMLLEQDQLGLIQIIPANIPFQSMCVGEVEFTQCYFDPAFIRQIAYESADPDRVNFALKLQQPDPLLWHLGQALKSILETNPKNSSFYADSLATAFAAHLVTHYATCKHQLKEYNGLPKDKLNQAIEYIHEHLGEDVSLMELANLVSISQYHFARLFKQSMGITAHQYLIQQRVHRAKQLLHQKELTILEIADACGFANPSHFAKHFQKQLGITPSQFRALG